MTAPAGYDFSAYAVFEPRDEGLLAVPPAGGLDEDVRVCEKDAGGCDKNAAASNKVTSGRAFLCFTITISSFLNIGCRESPPQRDARLDSTASGSLAGVRRHKNH